METMRNLRASATSEDLRTTLVREIIARFDQWMRYIAAANWRRAYRIGGTQGLQDIVSAGRLGLFAAIERWDPTHEKPVCHLAAVWISWSCRLEINRLRDGVVKTPESARRRAARYRELLETEGRASAEKFLVGGRTTKMIQEIVRQTVLDDSARIVSLDQALSFDEPTGTTLHDILPGETTEKGDGEEQRELLILLRQIAVQKIDRRRRLILHLRYPGVFDHCGLDADFNEPKETDIDILRVASGQSLGRIAKHFGLSRERVRQLHDEAIGILKREIKRRL